ncbi:MAG: exodeoxyribonuclease VII large subunit [Caldimonas sp.]
MTETSAGISPRVVWTVASLLHAIGDALAARFGACSVRGEISGFARAGSGHCYFNLKDADRGEGALRCAMFRRSASLIDFVPADGQLVEIRGRLGVYGARGELQMVVESMQRAGAGALYEQFVRLRARLQAEGLFDIEAKRPLPPYPRRIGVVTSADAAALHDVLTALARRAPNVEVVVYPSKVQGVDAPSSLCASIRRANERDEVDVLIVCRGGGSLEDLWAFNDERVVRAVRASLLPIVCGVGHETDVTLADLASDVRAPTPTAAAELAAPARQACMEALAGRAFELRRRLSERLQNHAQRLDRAAFRLARPADSARRHGHRMAMLAHRLQGAVARHLDVRKSRLVQLQQRLRRTPDAALRRDHERLRALQGRLDALDPMKVLARGYALLTDPSGRPVVSVSQAVVGARLRALLGDGGLGVEVTQRDLPGDP